MGKKTVRGHDIANRFVYSLRRTSFTDVRPSDKIKERETGLEPAASTLARSRSTN